MKTLKILKYTMLIFTLVSLVSCVKNRETFYLSENEKQFISYQLTDEVLMINGQDTASLIISDLSLDTVMLAQLGFITYHEQKSITLEDDDYSIILQIEKMADGAVFYAIFNGIPLNSDFYEIKLNIKNKDYITYFESIEINSSVYNKVFLIKSGGFSAGGVNTDSLYFNSSDGLIKLKSNNTEYRFEKK